MRYLIAVALLTLLIACDVSTLSPEGKYWSCMSEMGRMYAQNRPLPEKAHAMCSEKHLTQ